ncbi:MAG: hypothetical protein KAR44_07900 [Candidatus Aegiribacteria sp.]|nr:hypothetical protein [Candidatus Aegiribacteria sp.]
MKFTVLLLSLLVGLGAGGTVHEMIGTGGHGSGMPVGGPLADDSLFSTGPWSNSPGTGVGGADESILETWGNILGWGCMFTSSYVCADDFQVPAGELWGVTAITVGAFQEGAGTTPTINEIYFQIWEGTPEAGTLLYGDLVTNVFDSADWSGIYRVRESESGSNSNRGIMAVTGLVSTDSSLVLDEGTYWVTFMLNGSLLYGPWAPPVVEMGMMETGNAIWNTGSGWEPVLNGGYPQGLLVIVEGFPESGLDFSTWGEIKTVF